MTVAECQERISSEEFVHWIEHWMRYPFGTDAWQRGHLMAMLNAMFGSKKATAEQFGGGKPGKKSHRKNIVAGMHATIHQIATVKQWQGLQ